MTFSSFETFRIVFIPANVRMNSREMQKRNRKSSFWIFCLVHFRVSFCSSDFPHWNIFNKLFSVREHPDCCNNVLAVFHLLPMIFVLGQFDQPRPGVIPTETDINGCLFRVFPVSSLHLIPRLPVRCIHRFQRPRTYPVKWKNVKSLFIIFAENILIDTLM